MTTQKESDLHPQAQLTHEDDVIESILESSSETILDHETCAASVDLTAEGDEVDAALKRVGDWFDEMIAKVNDEDEKFEQFNSKHTFLQHCVDVLELEIEAAHQKHYSTTRMS